MPKAKSKKNTQAKAKNPEAIPEAISIGEYSSTLADLKQQIREAQLKASVSVNYELIRLYWNIGKTITEKQEKSGWGSKFIEKLAKDLQNEFSGVEGFSRRNVFRMRAFYKEYKIVPPVVAQINEIEHLGILTQIPWSHNIILMEKLDSVEQRLWYAAKTVENRWGKRALEDWIDRDIYSTEIQKKLPKTIDNLLPPIEEIEAELEK